MAGYLAASLSKTGTVGTYGGAPYPTVTIFMDGYAQGVKYYNEQKGTRRQGRRLGLAPSKTGSVHPRQQVL
jgi:basic membrane protein A